MKYRRNAGTFPAENLHPATAQSTFASNSAKRSRKYVLLRHFDHCLVDFLGQTSPSGINLEKMVRESVEKFGKVGGGSIFAAVDVR